MREFFFNKVVSQQPANLLNRTQPQFLFWEFTKTIKNSYFSYLPYSVTFLTYHNIKRTNVYKNLKTQY